MFSFPFILSWQLNPVSFLKGKNKVRRVKTIYDCQADNDDELTFIEGEVIVVTGEEDQEWWVRTSPEPAGHPRRGAAGGPFPGGPFTECLLSRCRVLEKQLWSEL